MVFDIANDLLEKRCDVCDATSPSNQKDGSVVLGTRCPSVRALNTDGEFGGLTSFDSRLDDMIGNRTRDPVLNSKYEAKLVFVSRRWDISDRERVTLAIVPRLGNKVASPEGDVTVLPGFPAAVREGNLEEDSP